MVQFNTTPNTPFTINLSDLIEYSETGVKSQVLFEDNNCKAMLFCVAQGLEIKEHTATRNVTVKTIAGQGTLFLKEEEIALTPGKFVFIPANVPHALHAQENLAFILTLSEPNQPQNQVSPKTINLIKSTAPLLKKQGQQITTRMYEIMFSNHPEIKQQFNMSDQADGSQPARLATAIYTYATRIDDLESLKLMVDKIAHRHVQTHVTPEQYPIVGESLLQAMQDVLGDVVTEDIMEAWREAYQILAQVFIRTEEQIYQS